MLRSCGPASQSVMNSSAHAAGSEAGGIALKEAGGPAKQTLTTTLLGHGRNHGLPPRQQDLAACKGQAVLVVNTASQCGFTPQYDGLQSLWETYKDRGLVVLGVPSNDFGGQEPGSRAEIKEFCSVNFDVDFPMSDKVVVRGDNAHPLYQWLAATLGASSRPRWNFYKYLIDANGQPVAYFSSMTRPQSSKITKAVEAALPR